MAKVLTTAGTVICGHGGNATLSSSAKLTVDGDPVLLQSDFSSWPFDAGCAQKDSSSSQVQCATITGITGGASTKLTVGGVAVLLDTLSGGTSGSPNNTDLAATAAGQDKLEAP
ncbi:MAG: hypothetical protein JJT90_12250 [Ectothiorhodospiraceae bacterium]|nr:hypothetical protein [Ectothiorhodospiraceae bacterium]